MLVLGALHRQASGRMTFATPSPRALALGEGLPMIGCPEAAPPINRIDIK